MEALLCICVCVCEDRGSEKGKITPCTALRISVCGFEWVCAGGETTCMYKEE